MVMQGLTLIICDYCWTSGTLIGVVSGSKSNQLNSFSLISPWSCSWAYSTAFECLKLIFLLCGILFGHIKDRIWNLSFCCSDLEPNQRSWNKLQSFLILLDIVEIQSLGYVLLREKLLLQSLGVSLDLMSSNGWESSAPQFNRYLCQSTGQPLSAMQLQLGDVTSAIDSSVPEPMAHIQSRMSFSLQRQSSKKLILHLSRNFSSLAFFKAYRKTTVWVWTTPECLTDQNSQISAAVLSLWHACRCVQKWSTISVIYVK